jgi:hypothetical protein
MKACILTLIRELDIFSKNFLVNCAVSSPQDSLTIRSEQDAYFVKALQNNNEQEKSHKPQNAVFVCQDGRKNEIFFNSQTLQHNMLFGQSTESL